MQHFEPLIHGEYYHIYNRGINDEFLFKEQANYPYFLQLLRKHVAPVATIIAHCLIESQFHIIIKLNHYDLRNDKKTTAPHQAIGNFCNAYTKAINKRFCRHGGLFDRPFKRQILLNQTILNTKISQIHLLPVLYHLSESPIDYKWNSCYFHDAI